MTEDSFKRPRLFLLTLLLAALFLGLSTAVQAGAPTYVCHIQAEYPHNPDTSTQGLFFLDGILYESSGGFGDSFLAQVDIPTGRHLRKLVLESRYFAEGITPLDDKLYLLTWLSGTGFTHSLETLERLSEFSYQPHGDSSEGWGLAYINPHFIRTSGQSTLHVHSQDDFSLLQTIPVHDTGKPARLLNELEYVGGMLLANVWKKDRIAVIDPQSGEVRAWIDLTPLRKRINKASGVSNGIAYDRDSGRLYVTGKKWDKLFEISIDEVIWQQPVLAE